MSQTSGKSHKLCKKVSKKKKTVINYSKKFKKCHKLVKKVTN